MTVVDLAAGGGSHEAPQLLRTGPVPLGGLPGERAERPELTLNFDQLLDPGDAERADQLIFQVGEAHEETEPGQARPVETRTGPRTKPGPFQAAPEIALLPLVAQARQPDAEPPRTEQVKKVPDVGRAATRTA